MTELDEEKPNLAQKTYFTTIRAKTDIDPKCVAELVATFKKQKNIKQFQLVVEKQGKNGPCTQHVHAYLHYTSPTQLATVKKTIKTIVTKYHNHELDGSMNKAMMVTNTCFVYKDYNVKYDDTKIHHGGTAAEWDAELFENDMPDEDMQAKLQAAVTTRDITTLWAKHEELWRLHSPDDLSPESCYRYLTHRFYEARDLDPVSDHRKLQQLVAGIFRYTHRLHEMPNFMLKLAEELTAEYHASYDIDTGMKRKRAD